MFPAWKTWGQIRGIPFLFSLVLWALAGQESGAESRPPVYQFEIYLLRFSGDDPGTAGIERLLQDEGAWVAGIKPVSVQAGVPFEIKEGKTLAYATSFTANGTPDRWEEEFVGTSLRVRLWPGNAEKCRAEIDFSHVHRGTPVLRREKGLILATPGFERQRCEDLKLELKAGQWSLVNLPAGDEKSNVLAIRVRSGKR